ncbi:S9 family peptidase [Pseudonocardia sp. MH-G8]|uniref:alpha/beta hydrolase family protein n=1 Tax=Pseudonocardia sp. MH-G8 TaxID=1854588 RepID=UPI001E4FF863|nr:alpha/beta fold hydrolase [Pseudonocardia sp. MH-G8]
MSPDPAIGTEHRDLPTVVLLHGGPWYRDSWGYDPEVQLLANRGYAVLQVDFRGSTGYGKAHTQAAIGQFAGRMHDDVIDALNWAINQGYTDRNRVAIYGSSYGGYAALVGAAFTPHRFAAAISYTGMSDLVDLSARIVRQQHRALPHPGALPRPPPGRTHHGRGLTLGPVRGAAGPAAAGGR